MLTNLRFWMGFLEQTLLGLLTIHPSSTAYPGSGRGGSRLSREAQPPRSSQKAELLASSLRESPATLQWKLISEARTLDPVLSVTLSLRLRARCVRSHSDPLMQVACWRPGSASLSVSPWGRSEKQPRVAPPLLQVG